MARTLLTLLLASVAALPCFAQEAERDGYQWWMEEPIRLIQTNLPDE